MSAVLSAALDAIYPPQCVSCAEPVDDAMGLCGPCWRETPFISGAICDLCGAPLMGGDVTERATCDDCLARPRPWSKGRSALLYQAGARRLVLGLKHGGREDVALSAGAWMAHAGREILSSDALLAPIPLHWSRLFRRRYNQAALLARETSRAFGCDLALSALKRVRRTRSLDHMSPDARFDALAGSVIADESAEVLGGRHVVLIDDVMTSGATLTAATEAALQAGAARVDVLTLARAVRGP